MKRLFLSAAMLVPPLLACSGVDVGRKVTKVVPSLQEVDPEYATEPIQCDTAIQTPSPKGCVMEKISCGDTVEGNTGFGQYNFGDDFYQKKFCTPARADYDDAPEATYQLTVPSDVMATVTLVSDCGDLDIAAVAWRDDTKCPTVSHSIQTCEMDTSSRGGNVVIATVGRAETHLIVVDGKKGVEGNFRLKVDCRTYR